MMAVKTINDLPAEVLSCIFSYVCVEDLVQFVRDVCCQWRHIVDNDPTLWKIVTFTPISEMLKNDLISILSKVPRLRNVKFKDTVCTKFMVNGLVRFCHNIRRLEYRGINLTSENLKDILTHMKSLESLTFGSNYINNESMKLLGQCQSLKCLTLFGDMLHFKNMLAELALGSCRLEEFHLISRESFSCQNNDLMQLLALHKDSLKCLSISSRKVDLLLLAQIRCCSQLKELRIKWNTRDEATDLTNIRVMNLTVVTLINYSGCAHMMMNVVTKNSWQNMSKLSLLFCRECDSQVVNTIIKVFPLLTELKLAGCHSLTDEGLEHVGQLCRLIVLDVSKCPLLTDEAVRFISSCLQLRHVALRNLNVTDQGIVFLASCYRLQVLDLDECDELTGCTLVEFVGKLPDLRLLSVLKCRRLENDFVLQTKSNFPLLEVKYNYRIPAAGYYWKCM